MAGDWIKMRGGLIDHPKVIAVTRRLQREKQFREWLTPGGAGEMNGQVVSDHALRCVTTALLMKVWSVSREHGKFVGDDLFLPHSTLLDIDQMAGAPCIGAAMQHVGWIVEGDGLTLPNFIEFNVPLTNAEKQAEYRKRQKSGSNGALHSVTKALPKRGNENGEIVTTREEKRREVRTSFPSTTKIAWSPATGFEGVTDEHRKAWNEAYPRVNISRELAKAHVWCLSNPGKRPHSQWPRFLNGWFGRAQKDAQETSNLPRKVAL